MRKLLAKFVTRIGLHFNSYWCGRVVGYLERRYK